MHAPFGKRHLTLEPLAQRVLLAADVINTSPEPVIAEDPDAVEIAGIDDEGFTAGASSESPDMPTRNPCDVNGDGLLTPHDALLVVNDFNANGFRQLTNPGEAEDSRLDVNGDGWLSPIDLLRVINALHRQAAQESTPVDCPVPGQPAAPAAESRNGLGATAAAQAWLPARDAAQTAHDHLPAEPSNSPTNPSGGEGEAARTSVSLSSSTTSLAAGTFEPQPTHDTAKHGDPLNQESAWVAAVDEVMRQHVDDVCAII